MWVVAAAYAVIGLIAVAVPSALLDAMNTLASKLELAQAADGQLQAWRPVTLAIAATLAAIALLVAANVRRHRGYLIPLLVFHCVAGVASLVALIASTAYVAYLVIAIASALLVATMTVLGLRASKAYFEAQTAWSRRPPADPKSSGVATVVALEGDDKLSMLDELLDKTGFFDVLERRWAATGKTKASFQIAIKPNLMLAYSNTNPFNHTDPELVERLIDRIAATGFSDIALVESQNLLSHYYNNRDVLSVARYVGYSTDKNYRIVDLTEEREPYDYGGRLGLHVVGPTWKQADFRVSFAKNKTHPWAAYTLTLKNVFGTLPMMSKFREYHVKREPDWVTIETLEHFPVHFGLIDAIYSSDGLLGVQVDPEPNYTRTLIGGENLLAVDWVGAKKMGLDPDDPEVGRFYGLAVEAFGKPEVDWIGDQTRYDPWTNVPRGVTRAADIVEEWLGLANASLAVVTAADPEAFPAKASVFTRAVRWFLRPVRRILYGHDFG